jgi:dephospho-CoA kinase
VLRIGLTGGIGTGKSYVRARLEARSVPTIDADVLARDAVAPGTAALAAIVERFGRAVLREDGALDRQALAAVVFADAAAKRDLEAIVHPAVNAAIARWFAEQEAAGAAFAVADVPLLFETGGHLSMDAVVVAACDPEEQVRRVMRRDGASEVDARRRMDAQWPIARKVASADYVIDTGGAFAETDRLVDEFVTALRSRAAPAP